LKNDEIKKNQNFKINYSKTNRNKKGGIKSKKKKRLKRLICKFGGLDTNFYVEREKKRKTK
jgi:hypothetical protein